MLALEGYDFYANIHLFSMEGLNFALDVNSGAIHILDEVGFRFLQELIQSNGDIELARLRCREEFSWEKVEETENELREAAGKGCLFSKEEVHLFSFEQMPVKALCLNVAHQCNLKCRYCFAAQGSFGGEEMLMSSEVGRQAVDFLLANSSESSTWKSTSLEGSRC